MDNPMSGWRVLTDCLRPGGLMNIGLYSELARQHIVKIKNEIKKRRIGSSNAEMRSFREGIKKSVESHHTLIKNSTDFYSLSTLRDLLFHTQEHRFTISQIKDHLDRLGLRFCGFDSSKIISHFKQVNTNNEDLYDLSRWQAYEEANPGAFSGMYQFWCQKVG
jgi:cellobiose-specific phosphotransferase system component IIA